MNYLTEARARRLAAAAALLVSGALVTGCGSASGGPANPGPGNQQPGNQGAANPTPAASALASSQDASVMFLIGSSEYSDSGAGSAVSARAGADGSVSVVFAKLASSATPNATITGQAQFTCRNA